MLRSLLALLVLAGLLIGQPASFQLVYPTGLPWDALRPFHPTNNPMGYPVLNPANWPVGTAVGDIDNDGQLDLLYSAEQRVLVAASFTRNAQGHPIAVNPIWAIFDPAGFINKSNWGAESSLIWDFDGDGKNEVAYIARGANGTFHLRVIDDNPTLCTTGCSNQLGTIPQPLWAAAFDLDSLVGGWSFRVQQTGGTVHVSIANVRGLPSARDIVVHQSQSNEAQIFDFNPATGLTRIFNIPWRGQETHSPHYFDVTGDGKEECLTNGAWDFHGCPWTYCSYRVLSGMPGYCGPGDDDHADAIQPIGDVDNDGFPDVLMVDNRFAKIAKGGPVTGCTPPATVIVQEPQLLFHHQRVHTGGNPFPEHGQTIAVGEFIQGPDSCGATGKEALSCPKGAPYFNGGGPWGSYLVNDQLNILASNLTVAWGPTGWQPRNVDWDGNRVADEVFNTIGGFHDIFVLIPSGGTNCGLGRLPDPQNGVFNHPYRWLSVASSPSPPGHFDQMQANLIFDFFGDTREEIVIPGAAGLFVIYNTAPNPNAGLYPSPWRSEGYRRRFGGPQERSVDYQALPTLVRVSVGSPTVGLTPNESWAYTATGHYSDGSTEDVTAYATWTSGNPAVLSFSGNNALALAPGLAAVRCTVAGINNSDAALAYVENALEPRILYAGWADTYLKAGQTSNLVMEVRVADAQRDVLGVVASVNGVVVPGLVFADNGTNGDRVAQDGTWTALSPNVVGPPPSDTYFEAVAIDAGLRQSAMWPYLAIPAGNTGAPVPGFATFPFASELFGVGPFLAGTGIGYGTVTQSAGGTVDLLARVWDPSVVSISTFLAGADLGSGMNDLGLGTDQFAGDGLWTISFTIPPGSPAGRYVFEHLGFDGVSRVSDAFPRLRSHQ